MGNAEYMGYNSRRNNPSKTEESENVASRHHAHQASNQAQGIPVLIPYPALRSTPAYYHQPIQYVPIFQEYPAARQGVGGGLQANLGPLSGGFGAGVGAGGLGGGLKFGLGSLGGFSANAGVTPSVVVSNEPGYTRYYTKYYTPNRYYTGNFSQTSSIPLRQHRLQLIIQS